jgi:hypothetical protein
MKRLCLGLITLFMTLMCSGTLVWAAYSQSASAHYEVNEVQFGSGSLLNATSSTYQAQQSLGATAGGFTSSASYWAQAGYLTPNTPFLEMTVNNSSLNLGTLSVGGSSTGTASFDVRAYTDSGYVVESVNNPPENSSGQYINNLTTPTASSPGTEQFGINLVSNPTSCPNTVVSSFGTNPQHIPNNDYANGIAASGYNTCGLFQYNKGDVIAESSGNGWGDTDYTISYLMNISADSRSGLYTMQQNLVAVATY